MRKIILVQFIVLLIGTLFAWFNFFTELFNWLKEGSCTVGCASGSANPFFTACFYGAIFFTIAFILNILILKRNK